MTPVHDQYERGRDGADTAAGSLAVVMPPVPRGSANDVQCL